MNAHSKPQRVVALCSVDGCGRKHYGHGYCSVHHGRLKRNGDLRLRRAGQGELARYLNEVVRRYDGSDCLFWPYSKSQHGYGVLKYEGRMQRVSRIICADVNGPAPTPKHDAAHSCGKGHLGCVAKRHLSWKTRKENMADTLLHGTRMRGERSPLSRLTESDVRKIRNLIGQVSPAAIAQQFGISMAYVGCIRRGERWGWLDRDAA